MNKRKKGKSNDGETNNSTYRDDTSRARVNQIINRYTGWQKKREAGEERGDLRFFLFVYIIEMNNRGEKKKKKNHRILYT